MSFHDTFFSEARDWRSLAVNAELNLGCVPVDIRNEITRGLMREQMEITARLVAMLEGTE